MEWYVNDNAKVARKVFELGLKQYINEPAYVLEYLKLLEHLNDKNNMRVLFERVLASLPPEKALEIWNKFLEFEYNFGDSESIEKVNQRRAELYPDQSTYLENETCLTTILEIGKFRNLINQFKFLDLYPCTAEELENMDTVEHVEIKKSQDIVPPKQIKRIFVVPDLNQMTKIDPLQLAGVQQQVNNKLYLF